jgi:hypothetical protein
LDSTVLHVLCLQDMNAEDNVDDPVDDDDNIIQSSNMVNVRKFTSDCGRL